MNVLISLKNGISMSTINGTDYPIFKLDYEYAYIACSNEKTANSFAAKTGGESSKNQIGDFSHIVKVHISKFDKIIEGNDWGEIINKYIVGQ